MCEIIKNAEQLLKEKYNDYVNEPNHINRFLEPCSIADYCKIEAIYDYKFYRWLFADSNIEDYGKNLTHEELLKAKVLFDSL